MFTGGFLAAAHTGMAGLVQAGYLTSSILCIGSSFASLPVAIFLNKASQLHFLV